MAIKSLGAEAPYVLTNRIYWSLGQDCDFSYRMLLLLVSCEDLSGIDALPRPFIALTTSFLARPLCLFSDMLRASLAYFLDRRPSVSINNDSIVRLVSCRSLAPVHVSFLGSTFETRVAHFLPSSSSVDAYAIIQSAQDSTLGWVMRRSNTDQTSSCPPPSRLSTVSSPDTCLRARCV